MRLRTVGLVLALVVLISPLAAQAQTGRTYRVGMIQVGSPRGEIGGYLDTFRATMRDLGYVEGSNLIVDVRYADRDAVRVSALVDELIALKPDVRLSASLSRHRCCCARTR